MMSQPPHTLVDVVLLPTAPAACRRPCRPPPPARPATPPPSQAIDAVRTLVDELQLHGQITPEEFLRERYVCVGGGGRVGTPRRDMTLREVALAAPHTPASAGRRHWTKCSPLPS